MFRPEILEAAKQLINTYGHGATRRAIEDHWRELTSPEVRELLALQLPRHQPHSREYRVIKTRLEALEQCIGDGIAAAFGGYDEAAESVASVINANTWDEVRNAVEANRHHLFPKVADVAFADLVMQPSTHDEESHILGGWNLLNQCRELGVEAAFEAQLRPTRGIILSPEASATLASANSPEELQKQMSELPELAPIVGRRLEGQAQAEMWAGFSAYLASMQATQDLRKRIETCRAALAEIDRATMPLIWAVVALDLADNLEKEALQQAAPDLQEPISLYRQALKILTPKGEPDQFGHAHHYLGNAYLLDGSGDEAENVEAAIEHYEMALMVRRRRVESIPWATTTANLGEALRRRARGDRAVDLERAVELLEQAIEVLIESRENELLTSTARLSLGAALIERLAGSRDENLNRAAEQLELVINTIEPDSNPDVWVKANCNLGSLYWERAHIDVANYETLLEQAETCFRAGLGRPTAETGGRLLALLHMGLGLVLGDQISAGTKAHHEAIEHYEAAVALFEQEQPVSAGHLGRAYQNLALIYLERQSGETRANREAAERSFHRALEFFSRGEYPVQRRDALRCTGTMYFQDEDWTDAHRCFKEAIEISDEVLGGCYTEPGKEAEVASNRTLYSHAAYCLVRLHRLGEALEVFERGKTRMLNEALSWKDLNTSSLTEERRQALKWSRDEIVRLEAENRRPDASSDTGRQARLGRQLRDSYRHLADLRAAASGMSDGQLALDDILREIPAAGALVVPIVTPKGSTALVLPSETHAVSQKHIVELPLLDVSVLGDLLAGSAGSGGWLNAYLDWLNGATSFESLLDALDLLAARLWEVLMAPIHERLTELGIARQAQVMIVPSGWLGLLPLHAASRTVSGERLTFCDDFAVSYAPSVRAARTCRQRLDQRQRQGRRVLVVANPTEDLRFASTEGSSVADLFVHREPNAAVLLLKSAARRSNVDREMKETNYHHFACHGVFDWTNPLRAGLRLAAGDWLCLPEILSPAIDLAKSRLVILSGCETGMSEFRNMPDEFISLPGAFLEAGGPAVISTLWPVDDVSTKVLITEFYRLHLEGQGVAMALRAAQMRLRKSTAGQLNLAEEYRRVYEASAGKDSYALEKSHHYQEHSDDVPFEHPFFWAAFYATGYC